MNPYQNNAGGAVPTGQALGALNAQYMALAQQMKAKQPVAPVMDRIPVPAQPVSKGPMTVNPDGSSTYRFNDTGMAPQVPQQLGQPAMANSQGNAAQMLQLLQQKFAERGQPNPFNAAQPAQAQQHPFSGLAPQGFGGSPPGLPGGGG